MPNKTLYPCTCNRLEFDPECEQHFSKETRIKITPSMQNVKQMYPEITWQELMELGLKEYNLLKDREFYNSVEIKVKRGSEQ